MPTIEMTQRGVTFYKNKWNVLNKLRMWFDYVDSIILIA